MDFTGRKWISLLDVKATLPFLKKKATLPCVCVCVYALNRAACPRSTIFFGTCMRSILCEYVRIVQKSNGDFAKKK